MAKRGETMHIAFYQLPQKGLAGKKRKNKYHYYYFLIMVEETSRICWVDLIEDKKALTLMFGTFRALRELRTRYSVDTRYIKTGVPSEFNAGRFAKDKKENPFERLLVEMKIRHLYQRPSATVIDEKIVSFLDVFKEEYLKDMPFASLSVLKEKLLDYITYYNERRPNAILEGLTPVEFAKKAAEEAAKRAAEEAAKKAAEEAAEAAKKAAEEEAVKVPEEK